MFEGSNFYQSHLLADWYSSGRDEPSLFTEATQTLLGLNPSSGLLCDSPVFSISHIIEMALQGRPQILTMFFTTSISPKTGQSTKPNQTNPPKLFPLLR